MRLIDADAFLQYCIGYANMPGEMEFCNKLEYALTKRERLN